MTAVRLENTHSVEKERRLGLRLWRRCLNNSWTGGCAASGIAATRENCPGEMIRQAQFSRSDEDQEFGILKRILPSPEQVSCDWDFGEARQAGDGASFFRIGETANQGRFVLFDANGLRQRPIGDNGNAVHAGAG